MKSKMRLLMLLLAALAMVAAACSSSAVSSGDDESGDDDADEAAAASDDEETDDSDSDDEGADDDADADEGDGGDEGGGDTIKIGVLLPLTGFVAGPGEDAAQGLQLYFDTFGDGETVTAGGTTIEFVLEDSGSDPAVALTSATKLVEVDDVDILVPGILASTGGAVGDALGDRDDVLQLSPYSCNDDFTQRAPLQGYARPGGWACSQTSHAFGKWAFEEAGYETIATACADYTFGYEHCGGFVDAFTTAGGTISEQIWFPPPNQDFGTYATQMNGVEADAIMTLAVGGGAVPFVTAYSEFGVDQNFPMLAGAVTTDQSVLRAMEPETVIGTISHGHWAEGADNPSTQKFVADFEAETGKIASYYAAANYAMMQWIVASLEATDGEFSQQLMLETMKSGMEVDTPFGPQTLDADGSPIFNVYIREVVEREDGKLWNVPIFTYEAVDQYFPFERDTYLEQATYTKEFQGEAHEG